MDIGIGIQILLPLSAQEAAAAGAAELEPVHILCAALKLAELPAAAFRDAVADKALVADLIDEEQRGLCKVLKGFGIRVPDNSTPLRRGLRGLLRQNAHEGAGNRGGVLHRSAPFKALFAQAQTEAGEAGEKELGAGRLVETLLSNPDKALALILA
jgi:hypothetical protein